MKQWEFKKAGNKLSIRNKFKMKIYHMRKFIKNIKKILNKRIDQQ